MDWKGSQAILSIATEISERKKAEREIALNNERLESLLNISQLKTDSIQDTSHSPSGALISSIATENKRDYTILVAEDEEVNHLFIEALFEKYAEINCYLIHAKNGKEAVDICLDNKKIDLILMDIKMPVMNGHEATKKIKSLFPNIPIIAQTAYSSDSDRDLALKHGCDGFVSKPLNKEELFGAIRKYIHCR